MNRCVRNTGNLTWKGFSPVWTKACRFSLELSLNALPHSAHTCTFGAWESKCFRSPMWSLNIFEQSWWRRMFLTRVSQNLSVIRSRIIGSKIVWSRMNRPPPTTLMRIVLKWNVCSLFRIEDSQSFIDEEISLSRIPLSSNKTVNIKTYSQAHTRLNGTSHSIENGIVWQYGAEIRPTGSVHLTVLSVGLFTFFLVLKLS